MALLDSKFQPWQNVREQLEHIIRTTDPEEDSVMVPHGIQLAHTLHHPHVIRCMTFYHGSSGSSYITQLDTGEFNEIYAWSQSNLPDEGVKCQRVQINTLMARIIFVPQYRVFVGYSPDVTLHVFSDVNSNCMELTKVDCSETILCMVYNEDTDELITGGCGFLNAWKMTNVQIRGPLVRGRAIESLITKDDRVRDLRLDHKLRQLIALCDKGIHIINYVTNKEIYFVKNWHASALTCFVFYRELEYLITASMDGVIKVWNAVVFKEMHQFIGHYASVTGLVIHPTDPLLMSSSKDGTVRMWRLDTFELTHRLNVGEKVLGMRPANQNQLFYFTQHDIKVWNFNQFHHLFTPVRSCVHKLARITSPSTPSRILCAAEDGGVRLISAVSGTLLTMIYPMPTFQVLTDIVYDPKNALIVTVLEKGDVLVFDCSTNPCQAKELLVPMVTEDSITCLALVKEDCALGQSETPDCAYLIFAGQASGQISLLESKSRVMRYLLQAHVGSILALESSHGVREGCRTSSSIGQGDRLISCGSDKMVKIWKVAVSEDLKSISISCLKQIACTTCPTHVSMLGNVLCTVLSTNAVRMFDLYDEQQSLPSNPCPRSCLAEYTAANMVPGIRTLKHLKDYDHTKQVTALCSCPSLGLFATTSDDGTVKLWDLTNTLVRELLFDETLRGICFANDRGDLLVGFQNHISSVSISSYLPLSDMETLVERCFRDEEVEEPFQFNPDLPLWFDLKKLPTYPTDLLLRRYMKQKLPGLRRQLLGYSARSVEDQEERCEEQTASSSSEQESFVTSQHDVAILQGDKTVVKMKSGKQLSESRPSTQEQASKSLKIPGPQDEGQSRNNKKDPDSRRDPEDQAEGESLPRWPHGQDKQDEGSSIPEGEKDGSEQEMDGERKEEEEMEEDKEEGIDNEEPGEVETEEEMGEQEDEEEEEEVYKPIIAPDGYVPNSVIRSIITPVQPPFPPSPREWKLKELPEDYDDSKEKSNSEESAYESQEPLTWASSEESTVPDESPVSSPPPSLAEGALSTYQPLPKFEKDDKTAATKGKRRFSLKDVGRLVIANVGHSEEREKTVSTKKKRQKGSGINTNAGPKRIYRKVDTLEDIPQDESDDERSPIEALLAEVTDSYWYPKGLKMDVLTVVRTLLSLLDDASDEQYGIITAALLELNELVGLKGNLLDLIVRKFMRDLKSDMFSRRLSAIRNIANLHDDRPVVILSILTAMGDQNEAIKKEAAEAMNKLAGISTKSAMEDYLASIGIVEEHTKDPFDDLALRFKHDNHLLRSSPHLVGDSRSSPSGSYSPEMIEDWLDSYVVNRDAYEFKGKNKKKAQVDKKKKRRMSLVAQYRYPAVRPSQGQDQEGLEVAMEEFEEESEEESVEYWDEESDDDDDDDDEDEDDEEEDVSSVMDVGMNEQHLPGKFTKHDAMMRAKEAAARREKIYMERLAKEKMRKHIEQYEDAMKRKRRKKKKFLPHQPAFYKYYNSADDVKKVVQMSEDKQQEQSKYSVRADDDDSYVTEEESIQRRMDFGAPARSLTEDESGKEDWISDRSIRKVGEATHQGLYNRESVHVPTGMKAPQERASVRRPVPPPGLPSKGVAEDRRTIKKGIHYQLDKKRWGMGEGELLAQGKGTRYQHKYAAPVAPTVDSGLGDSLLTGTSQGVTVTTLKGTGTTDTLMTSEISSKSSGRGGMASGEMTIDSRTRPKSNLTWANVRRHELVSAHADSRQKPRGSEQLNENWRDFFLLPEIQEKRRQYEALNGVQGVLHRDQQAPFKAQALVHGTLHRDHQAQFQALTSIHGIPHKDQRQLYDSLNGVQGVLHRDQQAQFQAQASVYGTLHRDQQEQFQALASTHGKTHKDQRQLYDSLNGVQGVLHRDQLAQFQAQASVYGTLHRDQQEQFQALASTHGKTHKDQRQLYDSLNGVQGVLHRDQQAQFQAQASVYGTLHSDQQEQYQQALMPAHGMPHKIQRQYDILNAAHSMLHTDQQRQFQGLHVAHCKRHRDSQQQQLLQCDAHRRPRKIYYEDLYIAPKGMTINCIPPKVKLVPGGGPHRLLQAVTVGSKFRGQADGNSRKPGTTNYGALQMVWTRMVPAPKDGRRRMSGPVTMETKRKGRTVDGEEKRADEMGEEGEEGNQCLCGSFYKLQELDYLKKQLRPTPVPQSGSIYKWDTPLPTLLRDTPIGPPMDQTAASEDWMQPCKVPHTIPTRSLPALAPSHHTLDNGLPIVPRNSIASTCGPLTLPKIKSANGKDQFPIGVEFSRKMSRELSSQ